MNQSNQIILSDASSEELTKRLRQLKEQKLHRYRNQKYRYYVPVGKTEEFYNLMGTLDPVQEALGNIRAKYIACLYTAANGVGKTRALVELAAHIAWPIGNPYIQQPLFTNWPYKKKGRIISDPTTIKEAIIPEMLDQFPRGRWSMKYETSKEGKQYEAGWKTDTGWEFDLMTYEQDPKEFESANLGLALLDEPPPELIYKATIARLRGGGIMGIFMTPLSGSSFFYNEFITNPNNEAEYRAFMEAEVEDACIEHGTRGFLRHEDILKMVAQYDDEDKQARVFGKFQHLTGLVYKMWTPKVHVIKPFELDPADWCVKCLVDPHPRTPDAIQWIAFNRKGIHIIVNDIYQNMNSDEMAQRILEVEQTNRYRVVTRLLDPLGFNIDQHDMYQLSLADKLRAKGLNFERASKNRTGAIRATKDALHYQKVGDEFVQAPMLYVFDNARRTTWEFGNWQWENWSGRSAETKGEKEKPVDKDDHMMENAGRGMLDKTAFREMPGTYKATKEKVYDPYE